ncbi:MAG: hypothetical protein XU15_C0011G0046 [candidate division NC10 bacterium CSP1-5]|nr:MAG: hypothetical protein XU15_C0011G0046 [candidate division NC10 bacterium CSP1-5]
MSDPLKAPCGKTNSRSGKPWTWKSLENHITQCKACRAEPVEEEDLGLEMTELIAAGEELDGVFWGIAFEMGEGW